MDLYRAGGLIFKIALITGALANLAAGAAGDDGMGDE